MKRKRRSKTCRQIMVAIIIGSLVLSLIFGCILIYENFIYEEPKKGAILEVEEVYFVFEDFSDGEAKVSVKAFISNVGDEDCDVRIRAFAIDELSNIAMDDSETEVGVIRAETTEETSFELSVIYNGTFSVELMIFKDDLITVKGYGKISLTSYNPGGRDYQDTMTDPDIEEAKFSSTPFPAIGAISISVLLLVVLLVGFGRRRCRG